MLIINTIEEKKKRMNHLGQDKGIIIITLWIHLIILLLVIFWLVMFLTSFATTEAAHSSCFAALDSQRALVLHLPHLRKGTN